MNRTVMLNKLNKQKIDAAAGASDGLDMAFNDEVRDKVRFKKMFVRLETDTGQSTELPATGLDGIKQSVSIVGG